MTIALPILLLCLFVLGFWILSDTNLKWQLKTAIITGFFLFVIVFYQSVPTFLGWPAPPRDLPKVLAIRSVVIKEPNFLAKQEGGIFFLIEQPAIDYQELSLKVFSFNVKDSEPRLFSLPYSRKLHERMVQGGERSVMSRTQRGQIVRGSLTKGFGEDGKGGKGKGAKGDKDGKKGSGSESQEQEWFFYDLQPSYFQEKH